MTEREPDNYDDYRPSYRNRDDDDRQMYNNHYSYQRRRPIDRVRTRGQGGNLRYRSRYGADNNSMPQSEKVKAMYKSAFG